MAGKSASIKVIVAATVLALPAALLAQTFKVERFNIGGEGSTDYLTADPNSGWVYISRSTHVMVVDGTTGKVVGDILDTPGVHGIAFAPKSNHGFTTNGRDSTSSMFDLKTLALVKKIHAGVNGLDGIMYDDATDKILTINHSKPMGTAVVIDPTSGDVVGKVTLSGLAPEGGASDGKGRIYINIEDKNSIDVIDARTWKVVANWPIAPCEGPTGIALDRITNRIIAGCSKRSVVVDASNGRVVAQFANGNGVDALGWESGHKLIYIPAGRDGNVTIVHQDSPDKYTTVATVATQSGAKTITVDEEKHEAFVFTPTWFIRIIHEP
jgi:DNA-binding beta-propeller fold protein YncE